jgi:hypothetical protein
VDLQSKIPDFITEKSNIVRLVLFTASFALVFINFYSPFGVEYWLGTTRLQLFFYSSLIILTGVLVVVISRIIMFNMVKNCKITYIYFIIWILAEAFFMALFYALFEKIYFKDTRFFVDILRATMLNTALVLLLPYSATWLYFSYKDKKHQLEKMNTGEPSPDQQKNLIPFHDEKGVLRLSVKRENLLYIESSDNYVNIVYLSKDKISKFLLRSTLKRMEELFSNSEIVRCHRCYMVNFEKVKVMKKDKDGLQLELDFPLTTDIPVSRSYFEKVMETFSKYSTNS